jgi:hypothetical protein
LPFSLRQIVRQFYDTFKKYAASLGMLVSMPGGLLFNHFFTTITPKNPNSW